MIDLKIDVSKPWGTPVWNILWNQSRLVGKNKAVEFNGYRTNHIINVDFNLRPRGDHAGARAMLGLLGFAVELHFYDTRHWNYETNTWETYD